MAFGAVVLDAVSALLLAVVGGVYLAVDPATHRRGIVALLPRSQHRRAEDFLETCGRALDGWLLATLASMAAVGTMVGLGAWALGLPAPVALALFATLTEIVPVVGPIIGAVPALLVALGQGGDTFLWTVLLFVAVQQVEANLLAAAAAEAHGGRAAGAAAPVRGGGRHRARPRRPGARRADHGGRLRRGAEALRPADPGQPGGGAGREGARHAKT